MARRQIDNAESDRPPAEPKSTDLTNGQPRPAPHPDAAESVVPTSPLHEVVATAALAPGQPPHSNQPPEQSVRSPEDRTGEPETSADGDSPSEALPEESNPGPAELEKSPVQSGGANFVDFNSGPIIERLEVQGPLSAREFG